jgi:DNA helicase II / ATP-dependent DNA helicase PcrA
MEDLNSLLNPEQHKAVLHKDGPLLVLAGAGTGKTRIVTYRIAHLLSEGVDPSAILAVTFTNKAANEMKRRVAELAPLNGRYVWISTFHSFAAQLLRREADRIGLKRSYVIYDENDQKGLIKNCMQELGIDEKKYRVGMICDAIMRAKDNLIDADSYGIYAAASNDHIRTIVGNIYVMYRDRMNQNNALDFGDLLLKLAEAFHNNPALKEKYQGRFSYLLVDEYQDTNHAQCVLMRHLAEKHKNLFVVGDDDQSIYSWRGADVRNILEFEKEYDGTKVIKLEQNYMSTKKILECAWSVIKNNVMRKNKKLWTDKEQGEEVIISSCPNETYEAAGIADEIKKLSEDRDLSYNDFAVFYRTNAQSRVLEEVFIKKEIPYNIYGTVRFYDRMEIKDIIAYFRVLVNPDDSVSLKRILNRPNRGIGEAKLKLFEECAKEQKISLWQSLLMVGLFDEKYKMPKRSVDTVKGFTGLIKSLQKEALEKPLPELAASVLDKTGYMKMLTEDGTFEAKDRLDNIKEFISAVNEFYERNCAQEGAEEKNHAEIIGEFLSGISLSQDSDTAALADKSAGRVTLMTLHLAKGLEFPVVFITGLEEGLLPIGSAISGENELEEERRLCYVGMTRAKQLLYLTYSDERRIYGQVRNNIPSRFIREVQAQAMSREQPVAPAPQDIRSVSGKGYRVGQRICHAEFGEGRIIKISGDEGDTKVTVMFSDGKWRKLLLKYANLETM